jgi:hypothetical protein
LLSERVFSTAGLVIEKKRNRLSGENAENLIFLHDAWDKVEEMERTLAKKQKLN